MEIRWRPTIGDPSFMGWFTVGAYAVGAGLAAWAWGPKAVGDGELQGQRVQHKYWLAVAVAMAFLCVNKQFDLQTLFTEIGRVIARHQGWYGQRREVQKWFVFGVLVGAGVCGSWFMVRYCAFWMNHKLLTAGGLFLLTFIVIRAISFHHVEAVLGTKVLGFKVNWALELTGIYLVSAAAAREITSRN